MVSWYIADGAVTITTTHFDGESTIVVSAFDTGRLRRDLVEHEAQEQAKRKTDAENAS